MVQFRTYQANFTGGELSPSMQSRTDVSKYQSGVKLARNCLLKPQGGLRFRNGFEQVGEIIDSTKEGWLVSFVVAEQEAYILEFGENTLRFIRDGAYVLDSAREVTISEISAASPAVVTTTGHDLQAGEWVFLHTITDAPDVSRNFYKVASPTGTTFELQNRWGAPVDRTGLDAGGSGSGAPPYEISTPYTCECAGRIQTAQDQTAMYLFSHEQPPHLLRRIAVDNWELAPEDFGPGIDPPGAVRASGNLLSGVSRPFWDGGDPGSYTTGDTAPGKYDISADGTPVVTRRDNEAIGVLLSDGDKVFFPIVDSNGADLLSRVFTVQNANTGAGTFELAGIGRATEAPARVRWARAEPFQDEAGSGVETARPYAYRVAAISDETGEESLPSEFIGQEMNDLALAGNANRASWTPRPGASLYVVYKEDNGVFGFIGNTEATRFTDENIVPDLADTPQRLRNPFEGAGNYPKTGTFFEQRLWLANTENNPSGVWASQSASPRNLNTSRPVRDDDAITFAVRGQRITNIETMVPAENLLLLTSGSEWEVRGSQVDEVLTPTNLILRQRSYRGTVAVQPLLIGDNVLHVQRDGSTVRDLRIAREVESADASLLVPHLLQGFQIRDWAYSQSPDSIVWVVRDDGVLLTMTYMVDHEIWGWSRHELGGTDAAAESVAVVPEAGGVDAVYLTMRRTINGQTKRYVHRLSMVDPADAADAFHVDAGLRYDGAETEILYGFDHLEGETLVGLFDGNVLRDLAVENGEIELPVAAEKVSVGLPYTGRIETLDLDLGPMQDAGSVLGRYKTITEVTVRAVRTRGLFVGAERGGTLYEHRQRATENWGEPIALFTGDITITPEPDWGTGGTLIIEQRDPLPAFVTGVVVQWEFGE